MKISFLTKKLQKTFNSEKELVKKYGLEQTKKIKLRMKVLEAAANLAEIPVKKPDRCHQLKGDRKYQFAVDLKHSYRLVFELEDFSIIENNEIDLKKVTGIIIREVVDYHD